MNPTGRMPVVFDCTIFAQALININGPSGKCLTAAQQGQVQLFITDYVLQEIRELPDKIPTKLDVTPDRVDRLIHELAKYTKLVKGVPPIFSYDRDPDDAHYINLALATNSKYVVSRDNDLLDLMDASRPEGSRFRLQFPSLDIINPTLLLALLTRQDS